ncbi:conserved exported hypothetical protein [Candidatus Terasakiella magnetica]|nr:conserved exported hypothetical protein [Candidatus Terasakiella magnetica]
MKRALLPGLLLVLSAGTALAAMEPKLYVARRLSADHHIQIRVMAVEERAGLCQIQGRTATVFRSKAGILSPGADLTFSQPCAADAAWPAARLKGVKVLEVFLRSGIGGLESADLGDGTRALESASATPAMVDNPAVVMEMQETIARYQIDAEAKRNDAEAALALARVSDPGLRSRLLGHAAGIFSARKMAPAEATAVEAVEAVKALGDSAQRLENGLVALESMAMGGVRQPILPLADLLSPLVDAITLPTQRDASFLVLYGARVRAGDPAGALTALGKVGDPKLRRERLDDMPFALKDFGPANPASLAWLDSLLSGAEAQTDAAFRSEALTALCRIAYRSASGLIQVPNLTKEAGAMAELAARRRHAPSAKLLGVLNEAKGGAEARAEAARWYAAAASGLDAGGGARADALRTLASFTLDERTAAAALLGGSAVVVATPEKLVEWAAK